MKIGIFGDSYATALNNPTPGWTDIIAGKYNTTNHAISGSNLYFSIKLIKEQHQNFDKIILVCTQPGRLELLENSGLYDINFPKERFIPNIVTLQRLNYYENKKTHPNTDRVKILESMNNYFLYLQNYEYEKYVQNLMINDVKALRPDAVVVSGFPESYTPSSLTNCMFLITEKEDRHWSYSYSSKFKDIRNSHMTKENNEIFAGKVDEWLAGKPIVINPDDFVTVDNKEFYIKNYE